MFVWVNHISMLLVKVKINTCYRYWYMTKFVACVLIITHPPLHKMAANFADDNFRCIFVNGKFLILVKISQKFVSKGPIDNSPALVHIMAWHRIGDKPSPQPMLIRFTEPYIWHWGRWVKEVKLVFCSSWWVIQWSELIHFSVMLTDIYAPCIRWQCVQSAQVTDSKVVLHGRNYFDTNINVNLAETLTALPTLLYWNIMWTPYTYWYHCKYRLHQSNTSKNANHWAFVMGLFGFWAKYQL